MCARVELPAGLSGAALGDITIECLLANLSVNRACIEERHSLR